MKLDVPQIHQEEEYYCGPATAAMILVFLGAAPSASSTRQLVDRLWDDISGRRPPAGGSTTHAKPGSCGGFVKGVPQVFFDCAGGGCRSWATTTPALIDVLNQYLPADRQVDKLCDRGSGEHFVPVRAIAAVMHDLNAGSPSAALTGNGGGHWIVVRGFHELKKKRYFFVRDPMDKTGAPLDSRLADQLFSRVDCGPGDENSRAVVLIRVGGQ
jgi:hypothetical protein